jgi:hypothetical protein
MHGLLSVDVILIHTVTRILFLFSLPGGSQDLNLQHQFSGGEDIGGLQRQLSAPADVGLQRQVSQEITFQRQMSTPVPQDLTQQTQQQQQQQQQQFTTNPQFQPGQF